MSDLYKCFQHFFFGNRDVMYLLYIKLITTETTHDVVYTSHNAK